MEEKKPIITDEQRNAKWNSMLKIFHKITESDPKPETIKDALVNLKEAAINSILSPRQSEGIVARCDNYLKGVYGKTKTALNFSYGASPSSNGVQK